MTSVLLVNGPNEVDWAVADHPDLVVAMNAAAVDALDVRGVPHTPIGSYLNGPALAALDHLVVAQTVALVERIERAWAAGDAYSQQLAAAEVLSGQSYFLCHAASVVAARANMIRHVLERAAQPVHLILGDEVPPVFAAHGYARSPWLETVAAMVAAARGELEIRHTATTVASNDRSGSARQLLRRAARPLATLMRRWQPAAASKTDGLRLLLVDGLAHDWQSVAGELAERGIEIFTLGTSSLKSRPAFSTVTGPVQDAAGRTIAALPALEVVDGTPAGAALDRWRASDPVWVFDAGGVDILPDLMPYLRSIVIDAASVAASFDRIAAAAFDRVRPDVIGFWAMASFATRRFAARARRSGVPVVCYQHGGAYGTHHIASHALLEPRLADHLLTYGEGISFDGLTPRLPRARTWPVGSSRIEAQRRSRPAPASLAPRTPIRVLWAAETSTFNTDSSGFLVEDTMRFAIEREGLERLSRAGSFDVCYRPYPGTEHKVATVDWLRRAPLPQVRIDGRSPMTGLIADADLVVTLTSSGTVWNEVLAAGVPLLLFCEQDHPRLSASFAAALDRACRWCRSREAFGAALAALAADPIATLADWRRPTAAFVAQFVLPDDRQTCAARIDDALRQIAGFPDRAGSAVASPAVPAG